MQTTQITTVTPKELVDLISESVKAQILELSSNFSIKVSEVQKEFITSKETQALFNVSAGTIHDWQNNGILKVYKMGNRSYFKYSELLETLYKSNRS